MSSADTSTGAMPEDKKRSRVVITCKLCGKERLVKGAQARRARFRGMHRACYLNRKLKGKRGDQTLPKYGSIAHWGERKGELVPVTCGVCVKRHAVKASGLHRGRLGLHEHCYDKIRRLPDSIPIGNVGSILHPHVLDPADPSKRGVTCGRCKKIWYATPRYGAKALAAWSGICLSCRTPLSERELPNGTVALFNKRQKIVPASGKPYYKIAIRCRGCFLATGEEKYINRSTVTKYLAEPHKYFWGELCSDCVNVRGPILKLKQEKASSGTVTDFERENDKGKVPVIYTGYIYMRARTVDAPGQRHIELEEAGEVLPRLPP